MQTRLPPHSVRSHTLHACTSLALLTALGLVGCGDEPNTGGPPCTSNQFMERMTQSSISKIDLLIALDNSRSMADKQAILARAIPDLMQALVNPRCIDEVGTPAPVQPSSPLDPCPPGSEREYEPVTDIHIGVITSSIGGHGADSCPNIDNNTKECAPAPNVTNNDKAHLVSRTDACNSGSIDTYPYGAGSQDNGFLAWDPKQILLPPGDADPANLTNTLRDMVIGVGQIGCGYESQLESIYRFLADPDPYESISIVNNVATPQGEDTLLLEQRKAFLRPDSMLAVLMLTDENDCSIKEYGQFVNVGKLREGATNYRMPRARSICATDPNDPCCKSCAESAGNCPPDPTCTGPNGETPARLGADEDDINLRCWDQKRRFGIDFLYPTDRYVQAFQSNQIPNRNGELVPNPIFSDLNTTDDNTSIRDAGLVLFAGIVGVPWQDLARDPNDLSKGFKDSTELSASNANGYTTWDLILGDPSTANGKPLDPLMIESVTPRTGTNPITGAPLVDASTPGGNPINGHEWTIAGNDLQYACIFDLPEGTERDCTNPNLTACDCIETTNDNPLCEKDPSNNNNPTLQTRAKAYPSRRPLAVLKELGPQGIVASTCPARISEAEATMPDFGYRQAIAAIVNRLRPIVSGQCFPKQLTVDEARQVDCVLVEARKAGNVCACDAATGRTTVSAEHQGLLTEIEKDPMKEAAGWDCFCELVQATGDNLQACQYDAKSNPVANGNPVNGWCYVDTDATPAVGDPAVVAQCPDNEKRVIRFVGAGEPMNGATVFLACAVDQCAAK